MSEYTEKAEKFLSENGLEFRAVLVGDDCPEFCEDALADRDMDKVNVFPRKTHIHGKHYRCTFSGKGRGHFSADFWNSYADEEKNYLLTNRYSFSIPDKLYEKHGLKSGSVLVRGKKATVQAYDVLACIQKYDVGTFENFCGDFGYDTDSRRAERVYEAVCKEFRKVEKFFTPAELEAIQEIQ